MAIKTIIGAKPDFWRPQPEHNNFLYVAEMFCDTIQGEGINMGVPATFLRMQYCTQNCIWCDTKEVWRFGNPYTFDELLSLMEQSNLKRRFHYGQHLVLTGGSPLKQQWALLRFLQFIQERGYDPVVEIENECTLMPLPEIVSYVDVWNNSPKLSNSGNPRLLRYQPDILYHLSMLNHLPGKSSWFKFVITGESDWLELKRDFLDKNLIRRDQVILMPEGADRKRLEENRQFTVEMAIKHGVRYSTRMQVDLWDTATGV